ncbi:MAG TPA: hypothetical protein VHM70_11885, partial [Polyangiaceae bacterium]|nr:hypothetical protein [Polyangiaceae bacterium]
MHSEKPPGAQVLSPSRLQARSAESSTGAVRVAGRALSCAGLELVVADATAQLVVHFAPPLTNAPRPGNWVLVEGEWDGSALTSARLLSSSPGQL